MFLIVRKVRYYKCIEPFLYLIVLKLVLNNLFFIYYYNKAKYLKPPNNLTYIFSSYFRLPIAYIKTFTYLCTINLKQQIYENNKTFIY